MARSKIAQLICCAVLLCGCSRQPGKIVVGSKNFAEQIVLGEILAQHLERRFGQKIERKLNLGGTLVAHDALVGGAIDLYPEYTGTALTAILKEEAAGQRTSVFTRVSNEYLRRWQLQWMPPLGFNNTFAMAVRGDLARERQVRTLSDASREPYKWKLGAGYEFVKRGDGLTGLVRTYGLRLEGEPVTMDLGLLYRALDARQVDMVAANSTDGQLATLDIQVLADDKSYFPPYECAIVVRKAALAAQPGLEETLAQLSGKFDEKLMRQLNRTVQGGGSTARTARDFLDGLSGGGKR